MGLTQLDNLVLRFPELESCRDDLDRACRMLQDAYKDNRKVLICGNGGSAADAEHWAGELLKGFRKRRPLTPGEKVKLPAHLVDKLQGALPIIPITGFPTLSTAFANDVDPQLVFAQLVWALGQPGDVLIGISTSGNATNVCAALETAHARGLRTLGLTGKTGGTMKPLCDVIICAPATETYLVQEYHLPIYHYISIALEEEFFGGSTLGQENP